MKTVNLNLRMIPLYLGMLVLGLGFTACSDDDDDGTPDIRPTGVIQVEDNQELSGYVLTVQSVNVGQDSWLVAVNPGDENTNDFIAGPVKLTKGNNTNVQLTFDQDAITDEGDGQEVVLKLYADNPNDGTLGEWDDADDPIFDSNNVLVTKTITIFAEDSAMSFSDFDTNENGTLEMDEIPATYQNNFDEWDTDEDGKLDSTEFYSVTFMNTDANDDNTISEDEWNAGYSGMYSGWADNDFATFDVDESGSLDMEEWNAIFAESNWFETYDANTDTFVTEEEWNEGLFGDWDADDSNNIDEDEFNLYIPYVGFW